MHTLAALSMILAQTAVPAVDGLGGYRFGMTKEQVADVSDCRPYVPVRVTDGLECPNFIFLERKINVSFIFGPTGLRRIQLWMYEGQDRKRALAAITELNEYLTTHFGGVQHIDLLHQSEVSPEGLLKGAIAAASGSPTGQAQVRWTSLAPPPGRQLYAAVGVGGGAYMVFLFLSVPPAK